MKYFLCLCATFFSFFFLLSPTTFAADASSVDIGNFELKIDPGFATTYDIRSIPDLDLFVTYTITRSGVKEKPITAPTMKMQSRCPAGYTNCVKFADHIPVTGLTAYDSVQVNTIVIDWGPYLKGTVTQTSSQKAEAVLLPGTSTATYTYTFTPIVENICDANKYEAGAAYIKRASRVCNAKSDCVAKLAQENGQSTITCVPEKLACPNIVAGVEPANPTPSQEIKLKLKDVDGDYYVFAMDSKNINRRDKGKIIAGQGELSLGKFANEGDWTVGIEKLGSGDPQRCTNIAAKVSIKTEASRTAALTNPNLDTSKAAKVCGDLSYTTDPGPYNQIPEGNNKIAFTFSGPKIVDGTYYSIKQNRSSSWLFALTSDTVQAKDGKVTVTITPRGDANNGEILFKLGTHAFTLYSGSAPSFVPVCSEVKYTIGAPNDKACRVTVSPVKPKVGDSLCVKFFNAQAGSYNLKIIGGGNLGTIDINNQGIGQKIIPSFGAPANVRLGLESTFVSKVAGEYCTSAVIPISASDGSPAVTDPQCEDAPPPDDGNLVMGPTANGAGISCTGGVQTAIGCVPTEPSAFINGALKFLAGAGGGVALLLMISGSFQMIMSGGSADELKKGREQFIAALTGLLFIIFSITLLRIIGVDILQIPGFALK